MNDSAIKDFCINARISLIEDVEQQVAFWELNSVDVAPDTDVVSGHILTDKEKLYRKALLEDIANEGLESVVEQAAYTWFNRIIAIRYMELHDYLPSHVRILSSLGGTGRPQILDEALNLGMDNIDMSCLVQLLDAGVDDDTFRYLFLAQCEELSSYLPSVFRSIDDEYALLLPSHLLRSDGVIYDLVNTIDVDDFDSVEIVGWMYQYYNAQRKDEVFASFKKNKKAQRQDIAPATQLFTPSWIVRYLVQNSLGRLWMLNHPESELYKKMDLYIAPEEGQTEAAFEKIDSPEDIHVVDPACGSGHILVYAFDLLAEIYKEQGYTLRTIPQLILEKNIVGFEIDPRAAELACFALTCKALEIDSRFMRRDAKPCIHVLDRVVFDEEEINQLGCITLYPDLMDALAHLDECGSLFVPTHEYIQAIEHEIDNQHCSSTLVSDVIAEKLERVLPVLKGLAARYEIVVANPPYMGAAHMNPWLSSWVKKNYADVKSDLCTCFMKRCFSLGNEYCLSGLATSNVWMFLSTYESLRTEIVDHHSIHSLVQLSVHGFRGIAAQVCTFVMGNYHDPSYKGGYIRLNDFDHHSLQEPKSLEAVANHECGWFYRCSSDRFKSIPGSPIAYWVSDTVVSCFNSDTLAKVFTTREGMATAGNDLFLRNWFEVDNGKTNYHCANQQESQLSNSKWFPYQKGGSFRKWYGNNNYLVDWQDDGYAIKNNIDEKGRIRSHNYNGKFGFREGLTWTSLSSGELSVRYSERGYLFDSKGAKGFQENGDLLNWILGLLNSSTSMQFLSFLAPTLDFKVGDIVSIPYISDSDLFDSVVEKVKLCIQEAKQDWDSFETSWDFKKSPLI